MQSELLPAQPDAPETGAWDSVRSGWRLLYGGIESMGVSVESHDFSSKRPLDWGRSFHPESVEICLNLTGPGALSHRREHLELDGQSAVFYSVGSEALKATRSPAAHRFVTVELSPEYLARQTAACPDALHPLIRKVIDGKRVRTGLGDLRNLSASQQSLAMQLTKPSVSPAAMGLWFQAKVMEVIAEFLCATSEEMFCQRQQRIAHERVEHVKAILMRDLENPPSLEAIAREVGVSQFYLSRIFSQETQMTIPRFLRQIRLERAAQLLLEGRHNVTEAAFAVGYSSLGHFSQAFCEVMGCCPTLYPLTRGRKGAQNGGTRGAIRG